MYKTNRIYLAPIRIKDMDVLYEWINDKELVNYNSSYKPVNYKSHIDWFESIRNRDDIYVFGIYLFNENDLIGTCKLYSINYVHRCAELSIKIGKKDFYSKGLGTEAVTLLNNFGFRDLNLNRIYLYVFSNNERAIRVYEKTGFKKEGILKEHCFIDGKYKDIVVMAILRNEFNYDEKSSHTST